MKLFIQAEDGIGLPEQILDQSSFQSSAKLYFIFIQFDIIWTLNYFALIILNFLEVCSLLFMLLFLFAFSGSHFYWENLFTLSLCNSIQKPLWCAKYTVDSCRNRDYYYLGQLPYLTGAESIIYEVRTVICWKDSLAVLRLSMNVVYPFNFFIRFQWADCKGGKF